MFSFGRLNKQHSWIQRNISKKNQNSNNTKKRITIITNKQFLVWMNDETEWWRKNKLICMDTFSVAIWYYTIISDSIQTPYVCMCVRIFFSCRLDVRSPSLSNGSFAQLLTGWFDLVFFVRCMGYWKIFLFLFFFNFIELYIFLYISLSLSLDSLLYIMMKLIWIKCYKNVCTKTVMHMYCDFDINWHVHNSSFYYQIQWSYKIKWITTMNANKRMENL